MRQGNNECTVSLEFSSESSEIVLSEIKETEKRKIVNYSDLDQENEKKNLKKRQRQLVNQTKVEVIAEKMRNLLMIFQLQI